MPTIPFPVLSRSLLAARRGSHTPAPRTVLRLLLVAALWTPTAQAAAAASCQPGDSEFLCRLRSVLTLLDAAAVLLGFILVVAVVLAVRAYRRKSQKLTPEDLSTDAK